VKSVGKRGWGSTAKFAMNGGGDGRKRVAAPGEVFPRKTRGHALERSLRIV
jgi:hypothetical protein